MILFKVVFKNNVAMSAVPATTIKAIEWKENPYTILSIELYANNNVRAIEEAQAKANLLLKENGVVPPVKS